MFDYRLVSPNPLPLSVFPSQGTIWFYDPECDTTRDFVRRTLKKKKLRSVSHTQQVLYNYPIVSGDKWR